MNEDDVLIAARRKLLADPNFAALIGNDVGADPAGQAYEDGWVFRAVDDELAPDRNPRNSGTSAVVIGMSTSWTSPNRHNTLRFPEMVVNIYSDATRSADKALLIVRDGRARCRRVADVIRTIFNDVGNKDHLWPNGVYIVSSVLWTDIRITDIPNEDGLVVGDMSFALELG